MSEPSKEFRTPGPANRLKVGDRVRLSHRYARWLLLHFVEGNQRPPDGHIDPEDFAMLQGLVEAVLGRLPIEGVVGGYGALNDDMGEKPKGQRNCCVDFLLPNGAEMEHYYSERDLLKIKKRAKSKSRRKS